jgi:hypothetical protein
MSLFLALSLTSCVSVPVPNADYLRDCDITYLGAGPVTNADVVRLAVDREFDVRACNLDKAALRAWFEEQCAGSRKRCVAPE